VPTLQEEALASEIFYESITTPGMEKYANDALQDFTRLKQRETGVMRRILPPITVGNSDLVRQVDTALPTCVIDMEVDSPAAVSVPFGSWPSQWYIHPNRYRVTFHRILSPWFGADVDELRTNTMDIRQVLSDNAIKDMLAEEDGQFFGAVNNILGGSANTTQPFSGVAQWQTVGGSIGTRNSLNDALRIMTTTDGHLSPYTGVVNNSTIYELQKIGRDEMGGNISEDIFRNGWSSTSFLGMPNFLVTNKRNIVPDDTMFLFGEPKYMGKFCLLEDTTMYVESKAFMISYFAYCCLGSTIANPYSLVRADFAA